MAKTTQTMPAALFHVLRNRTALSDEVIVQRQFILA
jgi:hypothetical protein